MPVTLRRPSPLSRIEPAFSRDDNSDTFTNGDMVEANDNATDHTFGAMSGGTLFIRGVVQETLAASSTATRTLLLMDEFGQWEFTVASGTAADLEDVGGVVDVDNTNSADELDVATSAENHVLVDEFISATLVRGKIVAWHHIGSALVS